MVVEMKCEDCGFVFARFIPASAGVLASEYRRIRDELNCPRCNPPELSYGRLTESMLAEALDAAWKVGYSSDPRRVVGNKFPLWSTTQARFVLRLMNECYERDAAQSDITGWPVDIRDWLFELAKESAKS